MYSESISRRLGRLRRDRGGSVAVLAAALLPVAVGALALAIDMSSLYIARRQAQSAADLAAIAAASDLERAEAAAAATLRANGIAEPRALTVTKGSYTPDPSRPSNQRFQPGASPVNAVEVAFSKTGSLFFAKVFSRNPIDMNVRAVAANAALATFSIGSRLLAIRDGLLNKLLGAMLGSSIELSVMDYEGLIETDVKLLSFLDALATDLNLTGVTYEDVLNMNMTAGDILSAAATATQQDGNSAIAATLQELAGQASSATLQAPLSTLIDLGIIGSTSIAQAAPGLDASIRAMDLVNGTAALSNGSNQVTLDLNATVPGLLSLKVDLAVGERSQHSPWVAMGQPGATVYTAQTRLRIVAEVAGSGLLAGTRIRLPIGADIAYAKATLTDVSCSDGDQSTARAKIAARPGIARAWIGETSASSLSDLSSEPHVTAGKIIDLPLIKVTGRADVASTNTADTLLEFTQADVKNKTVKAVGTSDFAQTIVTTLLGRLQLSVQVGGLGIGLPGAISQLVANALGAVAAPLDQVVYQLLSTLGVHLGEADVRVHGIRCGTSVLAG
jgi:uncharacterized membrane protein